MIALTDAITLPSGRSFFFSLETGSILSQQVPVSHLPTHQRRYIRYCFITKFYPFFFLSNTLLAVGNMRGISGWKRVRVFVLIMRSSSRKMRRSS